MATDKGNPKFKRRVVELEQALAEARTTITALREQAKGGERPFRALFEHARDAMLIADDEGRYLAANPAAVELFGVPQEELLGKTVADFSPPELDFEAVWEQFLATDEEQGEFPIRRLDGTVCLTEYTAVPNFLPGRHLSILRDVTERKPVEAERESALYELGERVKEATLLHRAGRVLSEHDRSLVSILQELVQGIPPAWQYPAITAARITYGDVTAATANYTATPWMQQTKFRTEAGTSGSVEVVYLEEKAEVDEGPFLEEERKTLKALAHMLHSDLERREAEAALRRSEQKYRTLFETMAQGVLYHDAAGNIIDANPATERIFGHGREQILNALTPDTLRPLIDETGERLSPQQLPARIALRTGRPVHDVTFGVYYEDEGDYRWVKAHSIPQFRPGETEPYQVYTTFEDITDRKRTENAIREREAMLARTERVANVGSWEWEIATDTVTWSEEMFRIFGWDPEHVAPSFSEHSQHYLPEGRARLHAAVERAIDEGVSYEVEVRLRRPDGEIRHCVGRGQPLRGRDGNVTHLYGSFQDITERKAAEEALRRSEARYRLLFDTISQGVIFQNAGGEIVEANRAAEEILGHTSGELEGLSSLDARWQTIHEDGSPFPARELPARVALRTGEAVRDVLVGVFNPEQEKHRWLRVTALPRLEDGAEKMAGVYEIFEDVTAQMEEAAHRNRLAAIVEASEDGVVGTDLEAIVTSWNPGAERLSGYTAEEIVGQPATLLLPPEEQAQIVKILETVGGGRPVRNLELTGRRKDGSTYTASINASPVRGHQEERVRAVAIIGRDVTERKQREQQLRFQAQLLENVREAVVATDLERCITYWGPGAAELFGHTREEALGEDFRELVPFLPPVPEGALAEHLLAQGSWRGRTRHRRKDGQPVDLDTSLGLIRTEGAEPAGFLGVLRDVSDQVARERELAAIAAMGQALRNAQGAEETYRIALAQMEELFAPAGMALAVVEEAGDEIVTIATAGQWWGQEGVHVPARTGLTGRVIQSEKLFVTPDLGAENGFLHRHDVDERVAAVALPLISESRVVGVLWLGRAEPFSRWEQRVLESTGGLIAGAVHRARLYERLREQAVRLEQIMEAVEWGLLLLDKEGRIVLANDGAETCLPLLLEEVPSELEGHHLQQLGDRPLAQLLSAGDAKTGGHLVTGSDVERVFSVLAHPLEETSGWVLVVRDVTEERRRQAQLARQQRLASVGQLAAGIAHDFNNVISAIILYAQILQRDSGLSPKSRERLAVIFKQAQHAANLVSQILDFSRRSVMERAAVDLVPLFKEWHKLWQRTLPENIEIDFQSAADSFIVNADPSRLQQAVTNIVINARDAMPAGGRLDAALNLLRVKRGALPPLPEMAAGDYVAVSIADTGEGLSAAIRDQIFDPFFTTKPAGEGTGLGLAQAHGIVRQHDGEIAVESAVGEGSTFTIYLPLLLQQEADRPLPAMPERERGATAGTTILVVEDEEATRMAVEDALAAVGYRVLAAAGGREALALLAERKGAVDLVLTDMVLRDIGGAELIERVQRRYEGVRVLLMTGYPLDEESRARLEAGLVSWVQKPFTVGELLEKVEALLEEEEP